MKISGLASFSPFPLNSSDPNKRRPLVSAVVATEDLCRLQLHPDTLLTE